jgi:diacylglycerol O-acyltransferase / wax synthase
MHKLGSTDMLMLMIDSPRTPNQMGPVMICRPDRSSGQPVTFEEILQGVADRLPLAPMLRRRLINPPLGFDNPYWVDDPNFDLEFHVREIGLPRPGGWAQLCTQVSRIASRRIDLDRPPWELYVIEGLDNIPGVPPGAFALYMKIHHTAIDGQEGVQLVNVLTTVDPEASVHAPMHSNWSPRPLPSSLNLLLRSLSGLPSRPVAAAKMVRRAVPALARMGISMVAPDSEKISVPVPYTRFSGRIGPHRVSDAVAFDFADVKKIRQRVPGATVNDVALAIVGGAMRRYLLKHDELPELSLAAAVPISTRASDDVGSGGNQIDGTKVGIRTDIEHDVERLQAISSATKSIRTVRSGVSAGQLAALSEVFPGQLLGTGLRAASELAARAKVTTAANVTVTNVPGPRVPLYFLGCKILSMHGLGPIQDGIGLIHLVTTYCEQFTISIVSDRDMLPDMNFYVSCLRDAFQALKD